MKRTKSQTSDFYCTECGKIGIPIMRPGNKNREPGHLKKMYCIHCGKVTNHCEIRPIGHYTYENFLEEFQLGRFIDGQRIPTADLMECSAEYCHYNKNGKCWNSNYSFNCGHRIMKESPYESHISYDRSAWMW